MQYKLKVLLLSLSLCLPVFSHSSQHKLLMTHTACMFLLHFFPLLISSGSAAEKHSPSQMLLEWQESSETEAMEQPSCSTLLPQTISRRSSLSRVRANPTSSVTTVSKTGQTSSASMFHEILSNSLPREVEDSCSVAMALVRGGHDGAEEDQNNASERSTCQPLLCIQIKEPHTEVMFEGNRAYSNHVSIFNNPPVTMGTVDSQQQTHSKNSWCGVQQTETFSNQNQLYQPSCSQNGECGSVQQQPCLPYACTFCSRRYAHQCQLRIHERVHTGEKPYQCVQCGKSFGQFCSLKRHQMVHTGERPFPCPQCGKQFSTSTNLKVHQSVHTGEKRFHCSKCGKNFSFLSNLIRHQALHTTK